MEGAEWPQCRQRRRKPICISRRSAIRRARKISERPQRSRRQTKAGAGVAGRECRPQRERPRRDGATWPQYPVYGGHELPWRNPLAGATVTASPCGSRFTIRLANNSDEASEGVGARRWSRNAERDFDSTVRMRVGSWPRPALRSVRMAGRWFGPSSSSLVRPNRILIDVARPAQRLHPLERLARPQPIRRWKF